MIKEFFEKFWKEKKINKWNFLYKKEENDQNIYFIKSWKILLTINWQDIAVVWSWEISWEKSFLNKSWKPINAKAITNVEVFYISPEMFDTLSEFEKNNFLKQIILFISNRVYLLNDVINNISYLNQYISKHNPKLELDYFKDLFKNLFEIENTYLYKLQDEAILPIFESKINLDYREKLNFPENEISLSDKKIEIKLGDYLLILEFGKIKKEKYIIENTFIHSTNNLKNLAEQLENLKNEQLSEFLE